MSFLHLRHVDRFTDRHGRVRTVRIFAVLAMAILPLIGGLRVMMVSIVVFLPMQVFFVVGAIAIWIAARRRRPDAPSEVSA